MAATSCMYEKMLALKKPNMALSKRLVQLFELNFEGMWNSSDGRDEANSGVSDGVEASESLLIRSNYMTNQSARVI